MSAATGTPDPPTLAFGRVCLGLSLIGLGFTHFAFRQFTTGRAPPWPASTPGGVVWAYASGIVVSAIGIAMLARWRIRTAALLGAALIAGWALLRHVPVLYEAAFLSASWTRAGKALTLVGGLLAVAAVSPAEGEPGAGGSAGVRDALLTAARVCLGIFLLITGTQHFLHTTSVASLIPPWFPGNAVFWTRLAGMALLSGGVGLLVRRTASLAALLAGLMVFSWFWIVHIPRAFYSVSDGIAVFEALAVAGIAFILAGSVSVRRSGTDVRPAVSAGHSDVPTRVWQ